VPPLEIKPPDHEDPRYRDPRYTHLSDWEVTLRSDMTGYALWHWMDRITMELRRRMGL
jgi:hypothetical protein